VDQSAEVLGVVFFKVTPSQSIALKTFNFCGLSIGEIGTGVLPLSIITPDATSEIAVWATAGKHSNAEILRSLISVDIPFGVGDFPPGTRSASGTKKATSRPIGVKPVYT
jgi:hypothetical protein